MYEFLSHRENQLLLPDDFFLPFGGKLNKENRWVKLAQLVPWVYVLLTKDNAQLLTGLPVRNMPNIMTISQKRKRMPPKMWA
ncbi:MULTISPECIES: hypothetical protein [Brevibacillus]|uniref:Uncharacterized protein n=1 Tax=Brevibacillus fulvus TaxID=1125967 RepID=A0A939BTT8_9BACL|nr:MULTISPECIES: hypothetical protein [Brevibacillus]EJL45585.1 hypothetical protein PMI08_01684 [Brevibacillus sp. CF112]MBM7591858.1 hypothetical protein [Brevibacillus fulvus]